MMQWCTKLQVFTKTNLPAFTRYKVTYIHDMYFSHICHFRPITQPNPLKTKIFDPLPTQPNPTRGSTQPMDNSDFTVVGSYVHCIVKLQAIVATYAATVQRQWCRAHNARDVGVVSFTYCWRETVTRWLIIHMQLATIPQNSKPMNSVQQNVYI